MFRDRKLGHRELKELSVSLWVVNGRAETEYSVIFPQSPISFIMVLLLKDISRISQHLMTLKFSHLHIANDLQSLTIKIDWVIEGWKKSFSPL